MDVKTWSSATAVIYSICAVFEAIAFIWNVVRAIAGPSAELILLVLTVLLFITLILLVVVSDRIRRSDHRLHMTFLVLNVVGITLCIIALGGILAFQLPQLLHGGNTRASNTMIFSNIVFHLILLGLLLIFQFVACNFRQRRVEVRRSGPVEVAQH